MIAKLHDKKTDQDNDFVLLLILKSPEGTKMREALLTLRRGRKSTRKININAYTKVVVSSDLSH